MATNEIGTESFYKPEVKDKDKLSSVPNLETPPSAQKRKEPFVLSNWGGSAPENTSKP